VKVRDTLPALTDLDVILDYVTERSQQGANRIKARIQVTDKEAIIHAMRHSARDPSSMPGSADD
jgi:hypothetical protein